jgi:hypothetical protein
MQGGATDLEARHIPFNNLATYVEGNIRVLISQN